MWEDLTAAQAVHKWAQRTPQAPAVIQGDAKHSYETLASDVAKYVKALERSGIRKGMIVGIQCHRRYSGLLILLALDVIRAVPTFLLAKDLDGGELLDMCDALIVESPAPESPGCPLIVTVSEAWSRSVLEQTVTPADIGRLDHLAEDDDPVLLAGTSATTGERKYLIDTRMAIQDSLKLISGLYFEPGKTRFICIYNVTLGAAYAGCYAALINGTTIVFSIPESFPDDIGTHPRSHSALVLRDARHFIESFPDMRLAHKLASLRVLGAHLPDDTRAWLAQHMAERVVNSYSANETGQIAVVHADGTASIYPEVGVRIVDEDRNPLPSGAVGHIAVKTKGTISGYLDNPELTRKHFGDGWFFSSDVGYLDDANRLTILGRADDMLNLGGEKIAPEPHESRIRAVSGVRDCVLLSDDAAFGIERLVICVERDKDADTRHLHELIVGMLKERFRNCTTFFFDSFARTATGKVRRNELRKLVAGLMKESR